MHHSEQRMESFQKRMATSASAGTCVGAGALTHPTLDPGPVVGQVRAPAPTRNVDRGTT